VGYESGPASAWGAADESVLERWLARAGTGHSDFTDVSGDKYKHLAAGYADEK
jgi:hypothetical protein